MKAVVTQPTENVVNFRFIEEHRICELARGSISSHDESRAVESGKLLRIEMKILRQLTLLSVVTRLRAGRSAVRFQTVRRDSCLLKTSRTAVG